MKTQRINPALRSLDLPALVGDRVSAEGFIYIIEYSTGLVKPGRTTRPDARMSEHRGSAARHGIQIARKWVSQHHANYDANEAILLDYCNRHGRRMSNRSEFYSDVSYDDVLAVAQQLSYPEPVEHNARMREYAEAVSDILSSFRRPRSQDGPETTGQAHPTTPSADAAHANEAAR